jgi:hypothetical protein
MEGDDLQQHVPSHIDPLQMGVPRLICPCGHRLHHAQALHRFSKITFDTINDPNWGDQPTLLPVIVGDSSFTTKTGRQVYDLKATCDHTFAFTSLCIRKQKNNDNGQLLTYQHRLDSSWMCPTQASLNIVQCALHLDTPQDHPGFGVL